MVSQSKLKRKEKAVKTEQESITTREFVAQPAKVVEFPVFKTIKLGIHKSINELHKSLNDNGFLYNFLCKDVLWKTMLAKTETEVTLHVATAKGLTGKNLATIWEINKAICSKGYELCTAEVGPQLRLQYNDQPRGEQIHIALEPFTRSGSLGIFSVDHDLGGGRWLSDKDSCPYHYWGSKESFVFIKP